MALPAPTDPILVHFGLNYEDCNPSPEFDVDEEVSKRFHDLFADEYGCRIPFLGGGRYTSRQSPVCTRMSDYNTTQGEEF